ncbi:hypothetical protein TRFO_16778 [Tritrichomonas foetus]|uniref:Myb-like DNA-binding domain containing protein n=1 Tax=Tritrichomonas foetus TaxID=1144522 RepID=A0A1J4KPH6_9EUKA|nr:hypothetical protein TRFO_16777 [Tritrichomonas foetus]OHT13210.1 hypothetical protein TRFO_16778 [Tritrichomonas foetus]|eukprot:OHT13209.1 hypothetical protein TRFO_16777 [Tritrichomonas foetus]
MFSILLFIFFTFHIIHSQLVYSLHYLIFLFGIKTKKKKKKKNKYYFTKMMTKNSFEILDSPLSSPLMLGQQELQQVFERQTFVQNNQIQIQNQNQNKNKNKKQQQQQQHRQKFSRVEDQILLSLVTKYGSNNWEEISRQMINRAPKQCRDHYINFLMPCYSKLPFTTQEDAIIHAKFIEFGPKWTKMSAFLPGRSPNSIKNRWNYFISKHIPSDDLAHLCSFKKSSNSPNSSCSSSSAPSAFHSEMSSPLDSKSSSFQETTQINNTNDQYLEILESSIIEISNVSFDELFNENFMNSFDNAFNDDFSNEYFYSEEYEAL